MIELMIVIAIIGILAAIAIPQFTAYKKRGYVAMITSDCKSAQLLASNACSAQPEPAAVTDALILAAGFQPSAGVTTTSDGGTCSNYNLTSTGTAAWGLGTNTCVITFDGIITTRPAP